MCTKWHKVFSLNERCRKNKDQVQHGTKVQIEAASAGQRELQQLLLVYICPTLPVLCAHGVQKIGAMQFLMDTNLAWLHCMYVQTCMHTWLSNITRICTMWLYTHNACMYTLPQHNWPWLPPSSLLLLVHLPPSPNCIELTSTTN